MKCDGLKRVLLLVQLSVEADWQRMCFLLCLLLTTHFSYADDSLSALMQRMQSETAVRIAYQEIKHLELMDQPWHGSGFLYALSPNLMIKEQIQPSRVLMGVNADKLYYFDSQNNIRHQADMQEGNALTLNVSLFKALMNADEAQLKQLFQLQFIHNPNRWQLTLVPKQESQKDFTVHVSGALKQAVDLIRIEQVDGDVTEFVLERKQSDRHTTKKLDQLFVLLQGN
jgi:hypothetical protein